MKKLIFSSLFFIGIISSVLIFNSCIDPIPIPEDPIQANISLILPDNLNNDSRLTKHKVSDTIQIGIKYNSNDIIDSIVVKFDEDTTIVFQMDMINTNDVSDNIVWLHHIFYKPGQKIFTASLFLKDTSDSANDSLFIYGISAKIIKHPNSLKINEYDTIKISVAATGTDTIKYQWYKNSKVIQGFTDSTLLIPSCRISDSGLYYCIASNEWDHPDTSKNCFLVINQEPVFYDKMPDTSYSINEGEALRIPVKAYDKNTDTIYYSIDSVHLPQPDSVTFIGDTIFWQSVIGCECGVYGLKILASDSMDTAVFEININIKDVNFKPELDSIHDTLINEADNIIFNISASDIDEDSLVLNLLSGPMNSSFTDKGNGTGIFNWQTGYNDSGIHTILFTVSDGNMIDTQRVLIKVVNAKTYTITYNGNRNNSGTIPSLQTKTHGVALTLASNIGSLEKTGHTFVGWNTLANGNGTDYSEGENYTADTDLILYAKWTTLPTFTITYDGNENTGGTSPTPQTKIQGIALVLAFNTNSLVRTGYTFAGWNTETDGSGTDYTVGANYTEDTGLALYAKWTILPTYTITYDGNKNTDGRVPSPQIKTHGVPLTLASNSGGLVKSGYTFTEWNTAEDGSSTSYAENASYIADSNLTLYAEWTINTYTITYDGNENTNGEAPLPQTKTHGVPLILASNSGGLEKSGYTFTEWNTTVDGSSTSYAENASYTADSNLTLYAGWTINTYIITYDGNENTGGEAPLAQTKVHGEALTLSSNSGGLEKSGHTFTKWNTKADGSGTDYLEEADYTEDAETILYAQWKAKNYFVRYNGNGNDSGNVPDSSIYEYGSVVKIPGNTGNLQKTGHAFNSWNTASNGSGDTLKPNDLLKIDAIDVTLYAQWKRLPVMLTVSCKPTEGGETEPSGSNNSFEIGTTLTIKATPNKSFIFQKWEVISGTWRIDDPTSEQTTVTVSEGNCEIVAHFVKKYSSIYVDASIGNDEGDGLSWTNAFRDLQKALSNAIYGATIYIAQGTYFPDPENTNISFKLSKKMTIEGGYTPGGRTRNPRKYRTILSGELQGDNDLTNNSLTVITIKNYTETITIDGIEITGGYDRRNNGGGIDIIYGNLLLNSCVVFDNSSTVRGGGIYLKGGSLRMNQCEFSNNTCIVEGAVSHGGAIYMVNSTADFTGCHFYNNRVISIITDIDAFDSYGGAISCEDSDIAFSNCEFKGNSCSSKTDGLMDYTSYGGALSISGGSSVISESIFFGNTITGVDIGFSGNGGAVYCNDLKVEFTHCTFDKNSIKDAEWGFGGAVAVSRPIEASVSNCNFTRNNCNTKDNNGGALFITEGSLIITGTLFTKNTMENGMYGSNGGALCLQSSFSIVTNCTFYQNTNLHDFRQGAGGAVYASGTPHITNCTFTENQVFGRGGAIFLTDEGYVFNCILWNDTAFENENENEIVNRNAKIQNCIIQDNFVPDPKLQNLGDDYDCPKQIPIPANSPARDGGTKEVPAGVDISTDACGNKRDDKPDIGAYEVQEQ